MLSTCLLTLALIATASSFTLPDEKATITDPYTPPNSQSILQFLEEIGESPPTNQDPKLQDRDITFGPYSHIANLNGYIQWTFGDTTQQYNISIDSCTRLSDVAGIWDFEDGSRKNNATLGDIMSDLGVGTNYKSPERYAARLLANDLEADNEAHDYLDTILCQPNSSIPYTRRSLFARDDRDPVGGFKLALVKKTVVGLVCGILVSEVSNKWEANNYQIAGGALAGTLIVAGSDIIAYRQMLGRYDDWQVWIGGLWTALFRYIVALATGAPPVAGPCQQEIEMVDMAGGLATANDPGLLLVPVGAPIGRTQSCPDILV